MKHDVKLMANDSTGAGVLSISHTDWNGPVVDFNFKRDDVDVSFCVRGGEINRLLIAILGG